jgi:transposase InsO family protein
LTRWRTLQQSFTSASLEARGRPVVIAMRVIAGWIQCYNTRRPDQALGMKTPAEPHAPAV